MSVARSHSASGLRPPRDASRAETERGRITVWTLAPHVYATEAEGYMTREMAQRVIEHASPLYEAGGVVHGFHNWLAMAGYDSICRVELTAWVLQHRSQSTLHIATASRLVAMGVSVAKLAVGDLLHVHRDLDALERALAGALAPHA